MKNLLLLISLLFLFPITANAELTDNYVATHRSTVQLYVLLKDPNSIKQPNQFLPIGTGVVVSENGYILTTKHNVTIENREAMAVLLDGTELVVVDEYTLDPKFDVALVKINARNLIPAKIDFNRKLKHGQETFILSYTMANMIINETPVIHRGIVSDPSAYPLTGQLSDLDSVQLDMFLAPGSSGGGIFDQENYLMGIAYMSVGDNTYKIGFAVPIKKAENLLSKIKEGTDSK